VELKYTLLIAALVVLAIALTAIVTAEPTTVKAHIETGAQTSGIVMNVGDRVTFPLEVTNLGVSGNIRTWARCRNVAPTVVGDNNVYEHGQKLSVTVILEAMNSGTTSPCQIYACDALATDIDATCDTLDLDVTVR